MGGGLGLLDYFANAWDFTLCYHPEVFSGITDFQFFFLTLNICVFWSAPSSTLTCQPSVLFPAQVADLLVPFERNDWVLRGPTFLQ